jgi:hypothetical protein
MESIMLRFLSIVILLLLPNLAQACDVTMDVCDFPSDAETYARATENHTVNTERRLLGMDRNDVLARRLGRVVGIAVVCANRIYPSSRGNYNATLCAPAVCLSLPPKTPMQFRLNVEVSRRARAGEAIYVLVGPAMHDCIRAHFNRFGWEAWRY